MCTCVGVSMRVYIFSASESPAALVLQHLSPRWAVGPPTEWNPLHRARVGVTAGRGEEIRPRRAPCGTKSSPPCLTPQRHRDPFRPALPRWLAASASATNVINSGGEWEIVAFQHHAWHSFTANSCAFTLLVHRGEKCRNMIQTTDAITARDLQYTYLRECCWKHFN